MEDRFISMPHGVNKTASISTTITTRTRNALTGISQPYMAKAFTKAICFRYSTTHQDGMVKEMKRSGLTVIHSHHISVQAQKITTTAHGPRYTLSIHHSEAPHEPTKRHHTVITPSTAHGIWMPYRLKTHSSST